MGRELELKKKGSMGRSLHTVSRIQGFSSLALDSVAQANEKERCKQVGQS